MTGPRLRVVVFLLGWAVFSLVLLRGAYVAPRVTYVAMTTGSPALWVGSFYPHDDRNRLSFRPNAGYSGDGGFAVERNGSPVAPSQAGQEEGVAYAAYETMAGDRACVATHCTTLATAGIVGSRTANGTTEWSNGIATTRASAAPYPGLVQFEGAPGDEFIAVGTNGLIPFSIGAEARVAVDFAGYGVLSITRVVFAVAFALIGALLIAFVPWRGILGYLAREWVFAALATAILGIEYVAVYPGLFNSDLVLTWANSDGYLTWYSSIYMAYTYLFALIGWQWIQLPSVVLALVAVCIIQGAIAATAPRARVAVSVFLILMLLFDPYLFATSFAGQRYFVAAGLALLGLSWLFASLPAAKLGRFGPYLGATGVLAVAGLMRAEYWIFWVLALGFAGIVLLKPGSRIKPIGISVIAAGLAYATLNIVLPVVFDIDNTVESARYRLSAMVDFAKPYACAGDAKLASAYGAFGPVDQLCAGSSEDFFWNYIWPADNDLLITASKTFSTILLQDVVRDPEPELARILGRFGETFTQPVKQIFDKYQYRSDPAMWTPHTAHADAMNIVWDNAATRPFNEALVGLMQRTGDPRLGLLPAIVVGLLVFGVLGLRRSPFAALTSLSVVVISLAAVMLSPVANWAYLAIAPTWAMIAIPCAIMERAAELHPTPANDSSESS